LGLYSLPALPTRASPNFNHSKGKEWGKQEVVLKIQGESRRKPSAGERAWFLDCNVEESKARTGSGFSSLGKIRVFMRDSPWIFFSVNFDISPFLIHSKKNWGNSSNNSYFPQKMLYLLSDFSMF